MRKEKEIEKKRINVEVSISTYRGLKALSAISEMNLTSYVNHIFGKVLDDNCELLSRWEEISENTKTDFKIESEPAAYDDEPVEITQEDGEEKSEENYEFLVKEALAEIDLGLSDSASPSEKKLACKGMLIHWYPKVEKEYFKNGILTVQKAFPTATEGAQWNFKIINDFFSFIYACKINGIEIDWERLARASRKATRKEYYSTIWYLGGLKEASDKGWPAGMFTCVQYNRHKGPNVFIPSFEEVAV